MILAIAASVTWLSGCVKDNCEREWTYVESTPVWVPPTNFRTDVESEAPRTLERPGKIYFYNDFIFINEQRQGIHGVDNSVPKNPQRGSFIPIEGNVDIAIRGNILYADHFVDLLAIDITDPLDVNLTNVR